jgi:hypothetical protein
MSLSEFEYVYPKSPEEIFTEEAICEEIRATISLEYLQSLTEPVTHIPTVEAICHFLENRGCFERYIIRPDGRVNAWAVPIFRTTNPDEEPICDVDLSNMGLRSLPVYFNEVDYDFVCSNNELTSLVGCPCKVRDIDCSNNKLTSLVGSPNYVRNFNCSNNKLTSLVAGPKEILWTMNCKNKRLRTLCGAPRDIRGPFYCADNPLKTLYGHPMKTKQTRPGPVNWDLDKLIKTTHLLSTKYKR